MSFNDCRRIADGPPIDKQEFDDIVLILIRFHLFAESNSLEKMNS